MGAPAERLPYRATEAAAPYERISELPVVVLLDNVRSLYNVGAFFRTGDAARIRALHLCGITGRPVTGYLLPVICRCTGIRQLRDEGTYLSLF